MFKKIIFSTLLSAVIGTAYSKPFPPGNFWDSCFDVEWLTPTSMAAYCQKMSSGTENSKNKYSVLENAQFFSFVQNIDGVLTCTPDAWF